MQSTDEVLPIKQQRSLASIEQQFFSCSLPYFSLPSKTKCNQEGDSIQSLPSRVSCEDSLNPNERDSDHCLDGSNEGRYWMKPRFEVFSAFIKKVWN